MHDTAAIKSSWVVWGLGLTQVMGYGALYYSFGPLAPHLAAAFGWPEQALYTVLTISLLAGGALAPLAGRLADRFGAGQVMSLGTLVAASALLLCALAPNGIAFSAAFVLIELASSFVLYPLAFTALTQISGVKAQGRIVRLTLIAGFASTLFWPLTTALEAQWGWRGTYLVFAGLYLITCLPVHLALARLGRRQRLGGIATPPIRGIVPLNLQRRILILMVAGFALQGVLSAAVLMHMVPLLAALELGASGLLVASLFGPAQVLIRVLSMGWGDRVPPAVMATGAAAIMPLAVLILMGSAPALPGALVFAVLFGFGSGLSSIVSGTLPLMLFGSQNYGSRSGLISGGRQAASAVAPLAYSVLAGLAGTRPALAAISLVGGMGALAFATIAWQTRSMTRDDTAS